jgi:hypothetical protein
MVTGYAGASGATGDVPPVVAPPRAVVQRACDDPEALSGGFERCSDGVVHRPRSGACPSELPRLAAFEPELTRRHLEHRAQRADAGGFDWVECLEDTDCVDAPHGHCQAGSYGVDTVCSYGCTTDADCDDGRVCLCGAAIGTCVEATCQNDRDCEGALDCAQYDKAPACGPFMAFACETFEDECTTHADCPGAYCVYDGQRRACGEAMACADIGRPFLVSDSLRVAPPTERDDWCSLDGLALEPVHPMLATDPVCRAELAAAWTKTALMEHASVASFARFALQLLNLGASAELLLGAASAMQDETRHAQACFALARRYGGEDVGPGELDVRGALCAVDFESIVLAAVEEGCIGETVSALEAAEAADHCIDAPTRRVLERIAREEAAHAELAWRFVAWGLRRSGPALRERVRQTFAAEASAQSFDEAPASVHDLALLRFGVVTPAERGKLRRRAMRDTVLPCARVLLSESLPTPAHDASGVSPV